MGHLNGILARVGGNLNNNFQKSQMPGGGMLKLRFDQYITCTPRDTYIYCSCVILIARFIKPSLAFLKSSHRVLSVVAGAIVLYWTLHCALRESDGRIKDEPK